MKCELQFHHDLFLVLPLVGVVCGWCGEDCDEPHWGCALGWLCWSLVITR